MATHCYRGKGILTKDYAITNNYLTGIKESFGCALLEQDQLDPTRSTSCFSLLG